GMIEFSYRGVDDALRRTFVRISPAMTVIDADGQPSPNIPKSGAVTLELDSMLEPSEQVALTIDVWTEVPRIVVAHTASFGVYDDDTPSRDMAGEGDPSTSGEPA